MDTSKLAAALFVFSILAISLYVYWKHPTYIKKLYWIFLISGVPLIVIGAIWAQGIPNGLIIGLVCAPAYFILGYLRFFWREKFAEGLIDDLEAIIPNEQKKISKNIRNNFGARLSENNDDLKKED